MNNDNLMDRSIDKLSPLEGYIVTNYFREILPFVNSQKPGIKCSYSTKFELDYVTDSEDAYVYQAFIFVVKRRSSTMQSNTSTEEYTAKIDYPIGDIVGYISEVNRLCPAIDMDFYTKLRLITQTCIDYAWSYINISMSNEYYFIGRC